ncbi:hypothetical protein NSA24_07535 [Clostridioides mangenotii]|uniref:hypothetical protein n=1 Tax=Metaclostridioides mangenotii TaxID=1540 RepID=UPI001C107E4C|nr:hypothetical protein [Clostridioides mangenotii]MBU5308312.1 hypothetical protein [Clostridioides mangenotii]MCR1954643.1 hypothetical protein [Clostridioides mangenotii]
MKLNKGIKFIIGLFIDIGISILLGFGPIGTTLFAILYVIFFIPDVYNSIKKH